MGKQADLETPDIWFPAEPPVVGLPIAERLDGKASLRRGKLRRALPPARRSTT
jgi:hypothetical protein